VWVYFVRIGSYSLDININCFTRTVNFEQWHKLHQQILLSVAEIVEQNGARLAMPTQFLQWQDNKPFSLAT
jgi:MscS family membrane protein